MSEENNFSDGFLFRDGYRPLDEWGIAPTSSGFKTSSNFTYESSKSSVLDLIRYVFLDRDERARHGRSPQRFFQNTLSTNYKTVSFTLTDDFNVLNKIEPSREVEIEALWVYNLGEGYINPMIYDLYINFDVKKKAFKGIIGFSFYQDYQQQNQLKFGDKLGFQLIFKDFNDFFLFVVNAELHWPLSRVSPDKGTYTDLVLSSIKEQLPFILEKEQINFFFEQVPYVLNNIVFNYNVPQIIGYLPYLVDRDLEGTSITGLDKYWKDSTTAISNILLGLEPVDAYRNLKSEPGLIKRIYFATSGEKNTLALCQILAAWSIVSLNQVNENATSANITFETILIGDGYGLDSNLFYDGGDLVYIKNYKIREVSTWYYEKNIGEPGSTYTLDVSYETTTILEKSFHPLDLVLLQSSDPEVPTILVPVLYVKFLSDIKEKAKLYKSISDAIIALSILLSAGALVAGASGIAAILAVIDLAIITGDEILKLLEKKYKDEDWFKWLKSVWDVLTISFAVVTVGSLLAIGILKYGAKSLARLKGLTSAEAKEIARRIEQHFNSALKEVFGLGIQQGSLKKVSFSKILAKNEVFPFEKAGLTLCEGTNKVGKTEYALILRGKVIQTGKQDIEGYLRSLNRLEESSIIKHFDDMSIEEFKFVPSKESNVLQGMTIGNVEFIVYNYIKRPKAMTDQLRNEFKHVVRKEFIEHLRKLPDVRIKLKNAGMSEQEINLFIDRGKLNGDNWNIHHKMPLDDNGTNDFENLILISSEAGNLTNIHGRFHKYLDKFVNKLKPGENTFVEFYLPEGYIYQKNIILNPK